MLIFPVLPFMNTSTSPLIYSIEREIPSISAFEEYDILFESSTKVGDFYFVIYETDIRKAAIIWIYDRYNQYEQRAIKQSGF